MFACIQIGRRMERQSQNIRRIIYGYNAVLTGLLLLAVIALPNVLAYAYPFSKVLDRPFEWTSSDFFAISPKTSNVLMSLKSPVKVYLLMPANYTVTVNSQRMLDYCSSVTGKISWELVDPQNPANKDRLADLRKQYSLPDEPGMLVVAEEGTGKSHEFVPEQQLYEQRPDPESPQGRSNLTAFKGRRTALLNAARLADREQDGGLLHHQARRTVAQPGPAAEPVRASRDYSERHHPASLRRLKGATKCRCPWPLVFGPDLKEVPKDATVVVVAGPNQKFSDDEVKVLSDYLTRKEVQEGQQDRG